MSRPPPTRPPPKARPQDPLISLIIPCYREGDSIDLLIPAIDSALGGLRIEMVFINDGSPDDTLAKLLALRARDRRVRVVNLSRNFGKEAALTAGFDHARGDVVVPMDADLQDPPEVVRTFLEKWRDGYDVVYGVRTDRRGDRAAKRLTAGLFYRIFNLLSDTPLPETGGDFRLMDRSVVDALKRLPERNRFMKGLFAWVGFPSIGVNYTRRKRSAGRTTFSAWRLWNLAVDGMVNFSSVPLRLWTYIGVAITCITFTYGAFIIGRTLILGRDVPGFSSLMVAVLFFGGVQLITLGVIGEYISRLFIEAKRRPIYVVERIYDDPQEQAEPGSEI